LTTPIENITEDPALGALLQRAGEIRDRLDTATTTGEAVAELREQLTAVKADINAWQTAENQRTAASEVTQLRADLDSLMSQVRTPSKAAQIGGSIPSFNGKPSHEFLYSVAMARSRDYDLQRAGKAMLAEWGVYSASSPDPSAKGTIGDGYNDGVSKATLGDSNAAGGFIVPNAVLLDINLQATPQRSVVDLFTQINGVRGGSVQIPFENSAVTRAVIAAPGATKENQDLILGAYTATLYTLARIFDVGNQLLRQSEGAAEQLVRSRLARAFGLGEDYYALSGSGSSQPYGLLTAIGTAGPYVSTFSSPSDSTVAGSVISAVITAAGAIAQRGGVPDGVVLNSADFYQMRRQGADAAGFWVDPFLPVAGVGQDVNGPLGLRWRHSPQMTTDNLVVGEYNSTWFIRGQGYRVDVSSEAGTRWDTNETGFRGEEEIAFDARPAVYAGRYQRIVNAVA
jgi:HK97 family phage major capsid protein